VSSPKLTYDVGDQCWIGIHGQKNLAPGKVVGHFKLPTHPAKYYIVELTDTDWPHLEIRDATLMASEQGQPLAYWTEGLYAPAD
jgi:hypothetical protein